MFKTRVLTALVGVPVFLLIVYLGGFIYVGLVTFLALLGLREYFTIMEKTSWQPVQWPGYIFLPLIFLSVYLVKDISLVLLLWLLLFMFYSLAPVFFPLKIKYWESALSFWGIVYLGALSSFIIAIRSLSEGFYLSLVLLVMVWSSDIMAYLVGRSVGKRPLARISPKKTIEGTIGGIAGSGISGLVFAAVLPMESLTMISGGLLGIIVGGIGALGDLTQSALKRSVNVKDSGHLFPGHGGVLDRFDSLFFSAPLFYYFIKYIGL